VPSKNIKDVSTDDQSFKVQSLTTIRQVNTLQREEINIFLSISCDPKAQ